MILRICPSCGVKAEGDLCLGCASCGARAVGPPLAKPEHELPSYNRAFVAFASGALLIVGMLLATLMVWVQTRPVPLRFWAVENAGEIAAWNLKWIELPLAIAAIWINIRLARRIKENPARFTGLWAARTGIVSASVATLIIMTLVGVTIPDRLVARRLADDATYYAPYYTLQRALGEYRDLHGTLPTNDVVVKELSTLPDPDGSIAEALRSLDPNGYKPMAFLAAANTTTVKSRNLRGGALRNASLTSTVDQMDHGVSFTTYELRLPGEDKILGTDDDIIVRDGVVTKVSDVQPGTSSSARSNTP
jgi:hypothetical protein